MSAAILLVALSQGPVFAVPACPLPAEFIQPDGTRIQLHLKGDEWLHWMTDIDGYPVMQEAGTWVYASHDAAGALVPTRARVGADLPQSLGLSKAGPGASEISRAKLFAAQALKPIAQRVNTQPTGAVKNLVILCMFADHTIAADCRAPAAYDSLFNQVSSTGFNAPTGSVYDFFHEFSYGALNLQSTVIAWVTLPGTEQFYANGAYGLPGKTGYPRNAARMVEDALNLVDPIVNFAQFDIDNDGYVDAIDIIHSGYGGEVTGNGTNTIWSHKSTLSGSGTTEWTSADRNLNQDRVKVDLYHTEPARAGLRSPVNANITPIGVIAHETGHYFGLPDLYDTDNSSEGLGSYCLMANAWGFNNDALHPPHPSAWCKIQLGWMFPLVDPPPGLYSLTQAEAAPSVIKLTSGFPAGEYLLIENRQPAGTETDMPMGGLAVWHVDENASGAGSIAPNKVEGYPGQPGWPQNNNHYTIALLQADGLYELEQNIDPTPNVRGGDAGDLYHDVPDDALSESTVPSSDAYQGGVLNPTGVTISNVGPVGVHMQFTLATSKWVDFAYGGAQVGSFFQPYNTVAAATLAAAPGQRIICKSGTTIERPSISQWVKLVTYHGPTTIGN